MLLKRWSDAAGLLEAHLEITQQRAEANPIDHERDLAHAYTRLGLAVLQSGRPAEALDPLRRSAGIWQTLADLAPNDPQPHKDLALGFQALAGHT